MNDINELRWHRCYSPDYVPRYLIDQIKHKDYSTDDFITYHDINCTIDKCKVELNPFSHLYVLIDSHNQVKGVLWFTVDPLTKHIIIQTYSVDNKYWSKGQAVAKLAEHIKYIRKKGNLNKIYWITNHEKHSIKHGFKKSNFTLMEYDDGSNTKRISEPPRQCESIEPRATTVSEPDTEPS